MDEFPDEGLEMVRKALDEMGKIDPDIKKRVIDELLETARPGSNVLLVGTEGASTVTILHVDKSLIGGEDGPVLLPTADNKTILAAVSREFLQREVTEAESLGGEENMSDMYWDGVMQELIQKVLIMHEEDPQTI